MKKGGVFSLDNQNSPSLISPRIVRYAICSDEKTIRCGKGRERELMLYHIRDDNIDTFEGLPITPYCRSHVD
jgi:hypothetical protein